MALQQMMLLGNYRAWGKTLMQAITSAGATSGLQLVLDAGDLACYDSGVGGTKFLDASGNGYDFNFGDGSTSTTYPTFTGGAGARDAYFALDGGDYFTYDSANETWMNALHKNSAAFTIMRFVYRPTSGSGPQLGTNGGGFNGITFGAAEGGPTGLHLTVTNASGNALLKQADVDLPRNRWNMIGVSLNEATGAGGGFLYANGAYAQVGGADTFNSTYTSPSASNASQVLQIDAIGGGTGPAAAGSRHGCTAIWSTALTVDKFNSIFSELRGRYAI